MFKILKQELLFLPIMMVVLEALRWSLMRFFPETALFDRGSELESFLFSFWQVAWISSSALILTRIIFPSAFYSIKEYYHNFKIMPAIDRYRASAVFYLALFFGLIWLVTGRAATPEAAIRKKITDTLHAQLHVREATGRNDGADVEKYLAFVGRNKGDAWCAAFASWNLNAVGISSPPNPKSGWSPNFATSKYTTWSNDLVKKHRAGIVQSGDCFTLYYSSIGRVGHVGFVISETADYFITIEGNTGTTGSREGSGVHKYKRHKSKVFRITNYITPYANHYAQTTSIGYYSHSPGILPQEDRKVAGKNIRNRYGYGHRKGFYRPEGCDRVAPGRQLANRDSSVCKIRSGFHAGSHCKLAKISAQSRDKWQSIKGKVPLSGAGKKSTSARAYHQEAFARKLAKAGYTIYPRNKGSAIPACMG